MNPEQLLKHFDRVAEAPDAVPRLRRFILDLAVRGKLVEQDPNDEPAEILLERIQAEKGRNDKRRQNVAEIDHPDDLGDLPLIWHAVPLIALGSWAIGSGFPKNEQGRTDGPYFFLKVSDMNSPGNEKYLTTSNNFIDDAAAGRMRARIHPPGTIVFPKIGGAIATNKRRILTRGSAIDNNCLGITFSSEVNTEWAYLLLTTLDFTQYQAGTAVPALQQSVLERIPVGLPPIAEQHRIVAKVDELMALCDRLEAAQNKRKQRRDRLVAASLNRINQPTPSAEGEAAAFREHARFHLDHLPRLTTRPEHIKSLRQTIFNLAVRGKLVPQDPKDEPASELIKRIRVLRAKTSGRRSDGLPPITVTDHPFHIPLGWQCVRFGEVFSIRTGYAFKSSTYSPTGTLVFRVTNFDRDGSFDLSDVVYFPTDKIDAKLAKFLVEPDEILMVMVGGTIGKTTIITPDILPALLNQNMWRIRSFGAQMSSQFEYLLIRTINQEIEGLTHSTHGHFAMGSYQLRPIAIPPLPEQHRIVAKVDELMAVCDQLEAQLNTTQTDSRRLLEAVLHEALAPAAEQELTA